MTIEKKKPTEGMKKQIKQIDDIISILKKKLQRCIDEPETLSSEAGVLTPLKLLEDRERKAIRLWQRDRRKKLRNWEKMGFDVKELKTKKCLSTNKTTIVYVVKTYRNEERFRTEDAKELLKHANSRGKASSFLTEDSNPKFLKHTLTFIKHLPTKRRPYTLIELEFTEQW